MRLNISHWESHEEYGLLTDINERHWKHRKSTRGLPIKETTDTKSKRCKKSEIGEAEHHGCLEDLMRADTQDLRNSRCQIRLLGDVERQPEERDACGQQIRRREQSSDKQSTMDASQDRRNSRCQIGLLGRRRTSTLGEGCGQRIRRRDKRQEMRDERQETRDKR